MEGVKVPLFFSPDHVVFIFPYIYIYYLFIIIFFD